MARLESGRLHLDALVNLTSVATGAVDLAPRLTQAQTIELTTASPIQVRGDAGRLEDVLLNLLTNAIKYVLGALPISVRLREVGREGKIQVEDRGRGIPAAALLRIFSRFYQVEHPDPRFRARPELGSVHRS